MFRAIICSGVAVCLLVFEGRLAAAVLEEGAVTVTQGSIVVGFREGTPSGDGTLRITPPSALSSGSLSVARGTPGGHMGRVFVEGGALNITSGGNIGETGIGRLEVTDGGIADFGKDLLVGGVSTSTLLAEGTIVVEGPGSRMRTGTRMIVGEYGLGEMYLAYGAVVSSLFTTQSIGPASIVANRSGSVGNVFIEGDDTLWQHSGEIVVGNFGTGAAHVTDGGNVISSGLTVGDSVEGGQGTLGLGSVDIDGQGSRWTTTFLVIGERGVGEVRVTNGGLLNVTNATQSQFQTTLGKQAGSFGRLIVSGLNSRWIDSRQAIVGDQGTGELWIEDGALVTNAGAVIGRSSTGNGLVVVRGEHTRWQASSIAVGGDVRSSFGLRSVLEVVDGATVSIGGTGSQTFSILNSGRVRLDRGTLAGSPQKTFSSSGILEGDGAVNVDFFSNRGSILIGEQQKLTFSSRLTNEGFGRVEIFGGELEAGATLTNLTGANMQMENATLRIRGESAISNSGNINLAGVNRVYGGFVTQNNSTGVISLAADSQTTFFGRVENNGQLKSAGGAHIRFTSSLDGSGVSGPGTVQLDGAVQPGTGFGARSMNFGGDVRFGDASRLSIDIRGTTPGTEFDELNIAGQASLNGALSLLVRTPLSAPATLTILRADELVGTFASVPTLGANLGFGALFNGIAYDYDQDAVRVSLRPAAAADFNTDGSVDGADFLAWQRQLGDPQFFGRADGNGDGAVDGADLEVWQLGFAAGTSGSAAAQQAVPEPNAAALILVGLLGLGGRRVVGCRAFRL